MSRLARLLQTCRTQDDTAWGELHAVFGRVAGRVLARFANLSPVEREEATDNAWERVALAVNDDRVKAASDGAVVSFLGVVTERAAVDVWRRRRPTDPLPPDLRDEGPSPSERAQIKSQVECVERLFQAWSPDNRFIFAMKLEKAPAALIKADLERLYGLFIGVEAVDVRFFRLRGQVRERCAGGQRHG